MKTLFYSSPPQLEEAGRSVRSRAGGEFGRGVLLLVILSIAASASAAPSLPPIEGQKARESRARHKQPDARALGPGQTIRQGLKGCDAHSYEIAVDAAQFLQVLIDERGVPTAARLFDPAGRQITQEVGSSHLTRYSARDLKSLSLIAKDSGKYRLEVRPQDEFCSHHAPASRSSFYEVRIAHLREANPRDYSRLSAEKAFLQGEELARRGADFKFDQKVLERYEEALALWRAVGDPVGEARTLTTLGDISYYDLRDRDRALHYYAQARSSWRAAGDRPREAMALYKVGLMTFLNREWQKGNDIMQRALGLDRTLFDSQMRANSKVMMALHFASVGKKRAALTSLISALFAFQDAGDKYREFDTRNLIGLAYLSVGERQYALEYFHKTLKLAQTAGSLRTPVAAYTLNNIGHVYMSTGEDRKALDYLAQALRAYRSLYDRRGEAITLNNLGFAHARLGQHRSALASLAEALVIHREVNNLTGEGDTLGNMMAASQALGLPRLAIFYGKQAVNAFQRQRRYSVSYSTEEQQKSFVESKTEIYHRLAELLIEAGRLAEAQQVLGLLKEEEYSDFLRGAQSGDSSTQGRADPSPQEEAWEGRYREISDRIAAIGKERGELLAKRLRTADEEKRLAELESDLTIAGRGFQKFLDQLSDEFGASKQAARVEHLRESQALRDDLRELGAGAVALYTVVGAEKYRVILVTPDAQIARDYPITAAELNRKVAAFRESLLSPKRDPLPLARELYRILVGPVTRDLEEAHAETLMWSLDGALRYIPMAALHDGERYMVERYRSAIFTPASNARLKDVPSAQWRALGLGVSKARAGFEALPYVPDELRGIIREVAPNSAGGVLEGTVMLDEAFTAESMRAALRRNFPVVHIASHFLFKPASEGDSFLLMGDGRRLTLSEIKNAPNLFGGVEMLTLSACDTAVSGDGADGREVESFSVLAQRQGAKAVVASLWRVADRSTWLLMQNFYRARGARAGTLKSEALRQAQLSLLRGEEGHPGNSTRRGDSIFAGGEKDSAPQRSERNQQARFAHPFYWAGFILIGNWK